MWVDGYYNFCFFTSFASTSTEPEQIEFEKIEKAGELKNMTAKHHLLAPEKTEWKPLSRSDINSIKYFLLFIGWPRSCHSIVGSLLDAHPNVIVAHEFFLFTKLSEDKELSNRSRLYNQLYRNSYMSAKEGWRTSSKDRKGYSLDMAGSWQGQFTKLEVIGDKCGGASTRLYTQNSKKFQELYQRLRANVKVPIKVLQIVRNPFDMIATEALYRATGVSGVKYNATVHNKYSNPKILREVTDFVLDMATAISRMIRALRLSALEIYCEDLVTHPAGTISDICRFLNLKCSPEYVQICSDKIFKNVSMSRDLVEWDPDSLPSLTNRHSLSLVGTRLSRRADSNRDSVTL